MPKPQWLHDMEIASYFGAGVWAGSRPPAIDFIPPWALGLGASVLAVLFFRLLALIERVSPLTRRRTHDES